MLFTKPFTESNLKPLLCVCVAYSPAFKTTLLSKRWSPLYYSFTAMRFNDETGEDDNMMPSIASVFLWITS